MRIAIVASDPQNSCNVALATLAEALIQAGWRVAGTVQFNLKKADDRHCDMDVMVLPKGPVIRISQNLGRWARGCRLDVNALECAVAAVEHNFRADTDVLIINKFGKHEAEGRGFRALIAEALAQDVPVICGVNDLNLDAFRTFSGEAVRILPANARDIHGWLRQGRPTDVLTEITRVCQTSAPVTDLGEATPLRPTAAT